MVSKSLQDAEKKLRNAISNGRNYLEGENATYEIKELERLTKQLNVKMNQLEADLTRYVSGEEKDDDKIEEYQILVRDGEEVRDDLVHYFNVINEQAENKRRQEERDERKRQEERDERIRQEEADDRRRREQMEFDERMKRLSMEENITLEKIRMERIQHEKEHQDVSIKVRDNSIKLPKLELKSFDGNIFKWTDFWNSFESTIHKNKNLHQVDKFNYLKGQLRGTASEVISGLELSPDNYEIAVNLLKERYGKKDVIIKAHYAKLTNLSRPSYKTTSLRSFYDTAVQHLRCLQSLGEDENQTHLLALLQSKLPTKVLVELERMKDMSEEWTMKKLRETLHHHISILEACSLQSRLFTSDGYSSHIDHQKSFESDSSSRIFTGEALLSNENIRRKYERKCIFCENDHWSDECSLYPDIQSRKRKLKDRCLKCMKGSHKTKDCKNGKLCVHCGEKDKHHRSLCPKRFQLNKDEEEDQLETEEIDNTGVAESGMVAIGEQVVMQTALIDLKGNGSTVATRALFDTGSTRTYVTEELVNSLKLKPIEEQTFSIYSFGDTRPKQKTSPVVELHIRTKLGKTITLKATVTKQISGPLQRTPLKMENLKILKQRYELADTIPLQTETYTLGLLIGNDHYYDIVLDGRKKIQENLYLINSKLGWILSGRTTTSESKSDENALFMISTSSQMPYELHHMNKEDKSVMFEPNVEDLWNLETIGIKPEDQKETDKLVMDLFENTIKKKEQRYFVSWPWRDEHQNLPENYELSLGRLKSLEKRGKRNPGFLENYNDTIQEQIKRNIVEKIDESEISNNNIKHYIPHHAVITPDKATTKVRIVYDASAKTKKGNKSLNECLHRGPVILEDLCGLLLRFRTKKIGIVADIEKAFLQVGLHETDRDVTRFLWLKDIYKPVTEDNIQICRFARLPFGIISSPFLLAATVRHHLKEDSSATAKKIEKDIYVDNLLSGADSEEEALNLYMEAKSIFQNASMNLREWLTNSTKVNNQIKPEDRIMEKITKVLGLVWNTNTDTLSIPTKKLENLEPATTKREVLTTLASIYDPLGMLTPATINLKIFLQSLWEKGLEWDDQLSEEDRSSWKNMTKDLHTLSSVCIPRYIGSGDHQLLCFCDASKKAYAAAIYIRTVQDNKVTVNLIFSKARNAPKKKLANKSKEKLTTPRLELLSTLIGVRILQFIGKELNLQTKESILWTDSQCVLKWLKQKENEDVFVRNRISEIKDKKDVTFRYVNTKHNPADLPTRGMTVDELKECKLWWHGPEWLLQNKETWPLWNTETFDPEQEDQGKTEEKQIIFEISGAQVENEEVYISSPFGIDETRYSTMKKLLRVTAYANRFITSLKSRKQIKGELTSEDIDKAEVLWIKYLQRKHYLTAKNQLNKQQRNNSLNPKVDPDGIVRLHGRLVNSDLSDETKSPILLPRHEYFSKLLITKIHKQVGHDGVSHTLSQLRQRYWIPQGRSTIKRILRNCLTCIRHQGGPYKVKPMSPWPKSKVTISPPFTNTGIDLFGPLYVKNGVNLEKVWICLFTCIAVRSVHLEMVEDMTAEKFLEAFRRFVARRGKPDEIVSDNAKSFKASNCTLDLAWKDIIDDPQVYSYLSENRIKWKYIIELSPWMGGFYERLVGTTKMALKKSIGKLRLTYTQLQTIITEIEAVVNSRPLVYVDDDLENQIITPNHFLSLNPKNGTPILTTQDEEEYINDPDYQNEELTTAQILLETWRKGNNHLDQFWKIWKDSYLLNLRERSQRFQKHARVQAKKEPKVGDVVQIKESTPRGSWKIGRIIEMIRSSDGEERAARLMMPNKNILQRSLVHLYPLECQDEEPIKTQDQSIVDDENQGFKEDCENKDSIRDNNHVIENRNRPKRKAAEEARDRIFGQNLSDD